MTLTRLGRLSALLAILVSAAPTPATAVIMGFEKLSLDFTGKTPLKCSWSTPRVITRTNAGLGWDGSPLQSRNSWIVTQPISVGTSWRPARSVSLRVTITPGPRQIKLPNGQQVTTWGGQIYARYSADHKHWSNWQAIGQKSKSAAGYIYSGLLGVPGRVSTAYQKELQAFMRAKVPWGSDEEALAKRLVAKNPTYFRDVIPFIGYVQVLWEGSLNGAVRMTKFEVGISFAVSGLHLAPKPKSLYNGRDGTWRFRVK